MARSRRVRFAPSPGASDLSRSNTANNSPPHNQHSSIGASHHSARIASALASNEATAGTSSDVNDLSGNVPMTRTRGQPRKLVNVSRSVRKSDVDVTSRTMYNYGYTQKKGVWILSGAEVREPRTKFRHFPKPPTSAVVSRTSMMYRLLEKPRPGAVVKALGSGFDKDITLRRSMLNGRKVALASMNMDGSAEELRQRLCRVRKEFDLTYRISRKTKRVVRMHNYCEVVTSRGIQAFWTMERASQSLADFASDSRRENGDLLLRANARSILRAAAKALYVIPRLRDRSTQPSRPCFRNFTHRDVKCDNLLFFPKARLLKLADLGFATEGSNQLRGIYGTKRFHAPEMIRGQQYDNRVDVFSYGRMAIELLVGLPFSLDIERYKRQSAQAHDWQTTKRKAKKTLRRFLDDYVDVLTITGIPPLEIEKLLQSPLRGFAALLEDVSRYWAKERLSFRHILRAPVMLPPQGNVEVISLIVGPNCKAVLELKIGPHELDSEEIKIELSATSIAKHCVDAAVSDVLRIPDLPPFDMDSLKFFLLAAFRSARAIRRVRSNRNLRSRDEVIERAALLNLATIDETRRASIRASDDLPATTPFSLDQARDLRDAIIPVPTATDSEKELDSNEESDSAMSYPDDEDGSSF